MTIARWVAGGVRTMLCFDPTRGIDIRTKQQSVLIFSLAPNMHSPHCLRLNMPWPSYGNPGVSSRRP